MSDYVKFECIHIAETDQNDPDERHALAYADIDGYPADDNAQGTVICRVWMLREKQSMGIYPAFIVDWHYNGYRMNKSVLELITQTKKDLIKFKESMVENVFQKAYSRYKLKWLADNGYTFNDLMDVIQKQLTEKLTINTTAAINKIFSEINDNLWFGDDACSSKDEFRKEEWKDTEYMRKLLTDNEYAIWIVR